MRRFAILVLLASSIGVRAQGPSAAACTGLKGRHLADTTITSSDPIAAGAFPAPAGAPEAMGQGAKLLPALCRVVAEIKPTPDSDIKMELWLPEQWNGRFRGEGNGGFAGEIAYQNMGISVLNGYASAGTDTGHAANFLDASWASGHPEKIADFGYRAIHLMTERSKELVAAYYGTAAKKSYFAACSDGGREALMEAQRFPADYDGILAGAPAYNWTALVTTGLHNSQALLAKPESYIPESKLKTITAAVLAACDDTKGYGGGDGVADGILTEPDKCKFKPEALLCTASDSDACLTAPELTALETIYAGTLAKDSKRIYPGFVMGGEADAGGWGPWIVGNKPASSLMYGFASGFFGNMVYPAKPFEVKTASIDQAYADAQRLTAKDLNATDPDLRPFFARGGKLILYHGWSDAAITPLGTIDYYNKVLAATGRQAAIRLYMVPGMDHCAGGPGADSFGQFGWLPNHGVDDPKRDAYLALQQWVEGGNAPGEIVATKYAGAMESGEVKMTRPICPYPEVAKYKGTGDSSVAESFACRAK